LYGFVEHRLTVHDHDVQQPGGKERFVPARSTPRLQAFPAEDLAFRRFVAEAFAALLAEVEARPELLLEPEELQLRLRARYPAAVVRPRDRLADPGEGEILWYVYRFGSVSPGLRWWEEPGHAWAILDDDRGFVEVSTSLTEIVEAPREAILGQLVDVLANPEDATALEDVRALWGELMDRGDLHATLRFRRMDGSPREIEYHVTKEGAGPGRHLAVVREIDVA
jgi:PAS domain-containing protein